MIIPAYNEELNIKKVVSNLIDHYPQYNYVVVNDGSADSTSQICHQEGYNIIDLPVNLGLAGAFQTGLKYADQEGYDCAIQFDADVQHRPEYIEDLLKEIEKEILKSDIGINPNNDGKVIRLNFPELNEERRKEIVKDIRKLAEEAKVAIRSIRRDAMDEAKEKQKKSEITEDDLKNEENEIQKLTDKKVEEIDSMLASKEKEIMSI